VVVILAVANRDHKLYNKAQEHLDAYQAKDRTGQYGLIACAPRAGSQTKCDGTDIKWTNPTAAETKENNSAATAIAAVNMNHGIPRLVEGEHGHLLHDHKAIFPVGYSRLVVQQVVAKLPAECDDVVLTAGVDGKRTLVMDAVREMEARFEFQCTEGLNAKLLRFETDVSAGKGNSARSVNVIYNKTLRKLTLLVCTMVVGQSITCANLKNMMTAANDVTA
jgi:hypothetical protein